MNVGRSGSQKRVRAPRPNWAAGAAGLQVPSSRWLETASATRAIAVFRHPIGAIGHRAARGQLLAFDSLPVDPTQPRKNGADHPGDEGVHEF